LPVTPEVQAAVKSASENAADKEFAMIDALYKAAEDYFVIKEQEIGKENYEQIMRYIALQSVDTLWMEHLDTMDHLRDSVRLRGYGQRDPLVEYKKEGFQMFQRLLSDVNKQIASLVLKVTMQAQAQVAQQNNVVFSSSDGSQSVPVDATDTNIGRNDPCPCGSGKKYKKCGLLNTAEHIQNMAKSS
jgi:preprotein translocase subunit SecA